MQKSRMIWVAISVVAAIAIGFIAGSRRDLEGLTVPVVRTYMVPPERADEIKNQLNRMFEQKDGDPTGRAQIFSDGVMIVRAPEGFQRGVNRAIEQLSKTKAAPRIGVHIDYWVVLGQEDKVSNAQDFPALANALAGIVKLDGSRKFRILEHMSSTSLPSHEVEIKGANVKTFAVGTYLNDQISLKIDINSVLGYIKTETQAKPGEFLVLGQSAVDSSATLRGTKNSVGQGNVYYIIRAEQAK